MPGRADEEQVNCGGRVFLGQASNANSSRPRFQHQRRDRERRRGRAHRRVRGRSQLALRQEGLNGRGYLELGYGSLFAYCTDCLKMPSTTAYRRITSARLIAKYPAILEYVRDGQISTTSLCDLRKVLNEDNHRELLERVARMTEKEIEILAATLDPKAEVADSIRRVPVRGVPVVRSAIPPASPSSDCQDSSSGKPSALSSSSPTESSAPEASAGSSLEAVMPSSGVQGASGAERLEQTWIVLPPRSPRPLQANSKGSRQRPADSRPPTARSDI